MGLDMRLCAILHNQQEDIKDGINFNTKVGEICSWRKEYGLCLYILNNFGFFSFRTDSDKYSNVLNQEDNNRLIFLGEEDLEKIISELSWKLPEGYYSNGECFEFQEQFQRALDFLRKYPVQDFYTQIYFEADW